MSTQSPMQEVAERTAEVAPGLVAAAHIEAVQDLRRMNADHRRRLADSHRWQGNSLGQTVSAAPEEDDVGNLIVTGDVYGSDSAEIIRSLQSGESSVVTEQTAQAPANPSEPTQQSNVASGLSKAALIAASLLGGSGLAAGVPWLCGAYDKPAAVNTTVTQPAESQGIGIEVVPDGALK